MNLWIAKDFSLPPDAVTETFGILAKRGSGKSYTAMKMAEQMLKQNRQIVCIDPTSAWWGLRASSNGKEPGLPILIIGGERSDVPLEETGGRVVADLAARQAVSMIIDLNLLSKSAMIRFMTEFTKSFYEMKAPDQYRTPVHVFIDEADLFAPQRPMHGQEQLLGSMEDVVRRGRTRGLGVSLITQRSAVLNKNVLTQAETLMLLRMTSPQDIGAVEEWIQYHQVKHEAEAVIRSLPSLPRGDAWIWSPGWLEKLQCIHVAARDTFDSSATPKLGERRTVPKNLADVDLSEVREKMAATIERAKAEDPKALKAEIAKLKRELLLKGPPPKPVAVADTSVARQLQEQLREAHKAVSERDKAFEKFKAQAVALMKQAAALAGYKLEGGAHVSEVGTWPKDLKLPKVAPSGKVTILEVPRRAMVEVRVPIQRRGAPLPAIQTNDGEVKLRKGARRMIAALCMWHPEAMTVGQMRSHAGLKKSGTFSAYMSDLRRFGLIVENGNSVRASDRAVELFGKEHSAPSTTEEVLAVWMPKLRDGARRMLRVLVEASGEPISSEELQEKAELAKSGTFSAYLSDLRTARLIRTDSRGIAADRETLFL